MVKDETDLKQIVNESHRTMCRLWLIYLEELDDGQIASLKDKMSGFTWIADFVNQENMVVYGQD